MTVHINGKKPYSAPTITSNQLASIRAAKVDHSEHGRESPSGDGPDEPDCDCRGTNDQKECAATGCGYCVAAEEATPKPPKPLQAGFQAIPGSLSVVGVQSPPSSGEVKPCGGCGYLELDECDGAGTVKVGGGGGGFRVCPHRTAHELNHPCVVNDAGVLFESPGFIKLR